MATWSPERVREALAHRAPLRLPRFGRTPSAVLILLVPHDEGVRVVLTRRSAGLSAHAGEVSFPGGQVEAEDNGSWETALREANEEIGILAEDCEYLGSLDDTATITGYRIRPYVAWLHERSRLQPCSDEVAGLLEVPLEDLLRKSCQLEVSVEQGGMRGQFPLFAHDGQIIWGATARICRILARELRPPAVEDGFDRVVRKLLPRLRAARKVVLATHVNPDPDGLGAQIALEELCLRLGKEVLIANHDRIPSRYDFLSFRSPAVYGEEIRAEHGEDADLLLVVDTAEAGRMGKATRLLKKMGDRLAVLDHHLAGNLPGDAVLVDKTYCSASEIVYRLLSEIGFPMTRRAVNALYAGLLFDTHGFRFVNNRAEPFRMGGHLVSLGADAAVIQERLFGAVSVGHVSVLSLALERRQSEFDGQWLWAWITQQELDAAGADDDDAGDIAPFFLGIEGVRVATFLRELPDGRFKVSFRSERDFPIGHICTLLGGGGHANAGGATTGGTVPELAATIRAEVALLFRK